MGRGVGVSLISLWDSRNARCLWGRITENDGRGFEAEPGGCWVVAGGGCVVLGAVGGGTEVSVRGRRPTGHIGDMGLFS